MILAALFGVDLVSKSMERNSFFNGDTGYSEELYEEIGKRCGPFDIAAIPIGAYQPREVMQTQHVDPDEAFLIHQRLNRNYHLEFITLLLF